MANGHAGAAPAIPRRYPVTDEPCADVCRSADRGGDGAELHGPAGYGGVANSHTAPGSCSGLSLREGRSGRPGGHVTSTRGAPAVDPGATLLGGGTGRADLDRIADRPEGWPARGVATAALGLRDAHRASGGRVTMWPDSKPRPGSHPRLSCSVIAVTGRAGLPLTTWRGSRSSAWLNPSVPRRGRTPLDSPPAS